MLFCNLHDQDAVLGSQADQGHQTHLGIDVEVNRAQCQKHQGAEHGQRHRHQNDHRGDIALVLGRQHQIDDQDAQAEHQNAGITG